MKTENFKPGKTPFSKGNCISTRQFLLFNTAAASCHIPPPAPPDKIFWVSFLAQNKRVQWLALTPEQLKFTGILTESKAKWPVISYFGKCSYSKSHSFASGESSWWKWYNTWRIHFKRFGVTVWQMCWKMPDYSNTAWSTEATRFPPLSLKWCKEKEIFNLLIQPFLSQLERREISQEMGWNWCLISRFISFSPQLHPNLHIRGDHFSCSQPWRSRQVWANQTPLSFRAKGRYCCRLCSVMLCLHLPAICCLPHLVICMYRSISEPATALRLTCPTLQLSKSSHLQVVWYPQRFRPLQQPFYPCGFQVQV